MKYKPQPVIEYVSEDFSASFSATDRYGALQKLAKFFEGLMDCEVPDKIAKRRAIRLAESALPRMRADVAVLERAR